MYVLPRNSRVLTFFNSSSRLLFPPPQTCASQGSHSSSPRMSLGRVHGHGMRWVSETEATTRRCIPHTPTCMHVPITLLGHEGSSHHIRGLHVGHDLLTKGGPAQRSEGRGLMLVMAELELLLLQALLPLLLHLLLRLLLLDHALGGGGSGSGGGRGGRGGGALVLILLLALVPCGSACLLRLRVVLHGGWGGGGAG